MRETVTMPAGKRTGEQILRDITDFHSPGFSHSVTLVKRHRPGGQSSSGISPENVSGELAHNEPVYNRGDAAKSGNFTWTGKKPRKPKFTNWEVERWNANYNWLMDMNELVSEPHH
jgi:hypothetical protein